MPNYRRGLYAITAYLLLIGLAAFINPKPAHPQGGPKPQPVTVTNTPLPVSLQGSATVSGNVNVANTPDVNVANQPTVNLASGTTVGINGTPTVNLGSGATVGIDPSANGVRDVDNPARHAFQQRVSVDAPQTGVFSEGSFQVPSGKRLVIEFISADVAAPGGPPPLVFIQAIGGGGKSVVNIPLGQADASDPSQTVWTGNTFTRLYADGGTYVGVLLGSASNAPAGDINMVASISGYLVDMP
jgi:hypothetical protein